MFIRFVRLQVREGCENDFRAFYESRVIPALQATSGCHFAGLLRPWQGSDHKSLTIWETADDARAYEESGLYTSLLRGAEPMLSASTAWRVQLGSDPEETLDRERREIPPDGYTVEGGDSTDRIEDAPRSSFVRIVSIRVAEGRLEEFQRIYEETVVPAVKEQSGCRGILLAEGMEDPNEVLSVSLWDREENAVRYEMSGEFDRLTNRLRETFSPVKDWRMSLGPEGESPETPDTEGYHFVTSRKL